jgi:hypothetical protein
MEHHLKTTILEGKPFGRAPTHESAVLARTLQVYGKIARGRCKISL